MGVDLLLKGIFLSILYYIIVLEKTNPDDKECDINILHFLGKYIIFYIVIHSLSKMYSIKTESIDMLFITRIIFEFTDSCKNNESKLVQFFLKNKPNI
jgi:hypothetical protein